MDPLTVFGTTTEFNKRSSTWHFDSAKTPEVDSFTKVYNFGGNFAKIIAELNEKVVPVKWGDTFNFDQVSEYFPHDISEFTSMVSVLGIKSALMKYHVQKTGQTMPMHIDSFSRYFGNRVTLSGMDDTRLTEAELTAARDAIVNSPGSMIRFVIMLSDWDFGQVFQFGNKTWTHWKAGDCVTWDWMNMPHGTCNMSFTERPLLQITGIRSEVTDSLLASATLPLVST